MPLTKASGGNSLTRSKITVVEPVPSRVSFDLSCTQLLFFHQPNYFEAQDPKKLKAFSEGLTNLLGRVETEQQLRRLLHLIPDSYLEPAFFLALERRLRELYRSGALRPLYLRLLLKEKNSKLHDETWRILTLYWLTFSAHLKVLLLKKRLASFSSGG